MFDLKVISRERLIYQETVDSVRVEGLESDYELLSFHGDVAGLLKRGKIVINNRLQIPVMRGLMSFHNNRCVMLVEEDKRRPAAGKKKRK